MFVPEPVREELSLMGPHLLEAIVPVVLYGAAAFGALFIVGSFLSRMFRRN